MRKIFNGSYLSFFENLVSTKFPLANRIDKRFYPREHAKLSKKDLFWQRRFKTIPRTRDQVLGAFQPIMDIFNDLQFTFRPYKSIQEFFLELLLPLRGLLNLGMGASMLLGTAAYFPLRTLNIFLNFFSTRKLILPLKEHIFYSLTWLVDGVSHMLKGCVQILATIPNWLLRMPLKAVLTLKNGRLDLRQNEEIEYLLQESSKNSRYGLDPNIMQNISLRLHEEYEISVKQGQKAIPEEQEIFEDFSEIPEKFPYIEREKRFKRYIGLFQSRTNIPKDEGKIIELGI